MPGTARDRTPQIAGLVLGLAPAVIVPGALNRFVFGKLVVAAAAAAVLLGQRARSRLPRWFVVVIAAGSVLLAVAALVSAAPYAAVFGRAPRYEGGLVLGTYLLVVIAAAQAFGADNGEPRTRRGFLSGLAVSSLAILAIAVSEAAGLRPLTSTVARPGSLLGNASDEGAFGVLVLAPLAVVGMRARSILLLAGATAAAFVVVLSGSRGAAIGLVAVGAGMLVLAPDRRWRGVLVGALAVVVLAGLAVPSTRGRLAGTTPLAGATTHGRLLLYSETVRLLADHPLLGVGPSGFKTAIPGRHDQTWQREVGPNDPPDSPHDWILQSAAAGGIPLALLSIGALCGVLLAGLRRIHRSDSGPMRDWYSGATFAVAGYAVVLLTHFTSPGPGVAAAAFVGAIVAAPAAPIRAPMRYTAAIVAAALAVVFALAAIADVMLRQAIERVAARHYASANDAFGAAGDLRPWDADLATVALHAFAQQSQSDRQAARFADDWQTRALQHLRTDPAVRADAAAIAEADGDYQAARRLLGSALADDPGDPELLLRRGIVSAEAGDLSAAETDLLQVTRVQPRSPDPWRDLAIVYRLEHRPSDAAAAQAHADSLNHDRGGNS